MLKPVLVVALGLAVGAAHVAAQGQTSSAAAQAPQGNVETGRKLYNSYGCYQCHGYEAQGSSATGPRLGPKPLPLAAFSRYVRRPSGQMPPYGPRIVSDADLGHIHAFLQSLPAPTPAQNIPLLQK